MRPSGQNYKLLNFAGLYVKDTDWVLIDTETTGLTTPIFVVEISAQKVRGNVDVPAIV